MTDILIRNMYPKNNKKARPIFAGQAFVSPFILNWISFFEAKY